MGSDRSFEVPRDRHYDGIHHLWAQRDEGSGRVRVGIDSIGLESLGELAYVTLHAVGAAVGRGEALGSLEAAKMTSVIAAPVGGTVVARNEAVLGDPLLVNRDPYGDGWLVEIEPASWEADAGELIGGDAVAEWAAAETERLRAESTLDR